MAKQINWIVMSAVMAVLMVAMPPALAANLLNSDFEGGSIQGWGRQDGKLSGAITVQSRVVRAGKYAVKLHIKRCSWMAPLCGPRPVGLKKPRAQLGNGGKVRFSVGKAYWIGWSVFVPNNWVIDSKVHDTLMEVHAKNGSGGPGTCVSSPQPIQTNINGNQWMFNYTTNPKQGARTSMGAIEKGRWTDFVINFKFSYGNDGFFKVWKNGKQVVSKNGNTVCAGSNKSNAKNTLPLLNATLYKGGWKNTTASPAKERTVYYDEIRVADSSASYKDVAPRGAAKAGSASAPVQKTTVAANRKPVAKKSTAKKKKTNIKTCNKLKRKRRANCRKRVRKQNRSLKR